MNRVTPPISDSGVENLRFAIVEQAVEDYFSLLAGFITPKTDCNETELENFFHSQWFKTLCDLNPDYIINAIRERAKKMVLKYTISKEKGSNRYYVHAVNEKAPIPGTTGMNKKQALHKAAELNGIDYKDYMRVRRRDGVKDGVQESNVPGTDMVHD